MNISKVRIENFKCFNGMFCLELNKGVNILVGNNEAGKSTILEAVHLALTGMLNGRFLKNELSQYLFNKTVENRYIASLDTESHLAPPHILIELYLSGGESSEFAALLGNYNSDRSNEYGVLLLIEFDEQYQAEYEKLVETKTIKTIPIEYYKVTWRSFARDPITVRSIPIKSAMIDSGAARFQNGSDVYVGRIIREGLEDKEKVEISQAHREMKEAFMAMASVQAINKKINKHARITDKVVKISVDLSTQHAWETSLITYLDEIPFHYVGKGEQSIVKTNLALSHKKSKEASIILLEEPENHLSHTRLNELVKRITSDIGDKQVIVSTHSSFVANKLGLDHLIFLNDHKSVRLKDLSSDTKQFFAKLAGYDTLRLVLCRKAILVEGDSDELAVQKAYMIANSGRLPIEDGIDVISVGTSFLRFLEIADKINKNVAVVTDNDGNVEALKQKYKDYEERKSIKVCFDGTIDTGPRKEFNYNTLEPKLLKANGRDVLNQSFDTEFESDEELLVHMKANKTSCALKIFETDVAVKFPEYITDAITAVSEK